MALAILKPISNSDTVILVTGTITLQTNGGIILIESEKIHYSSASNNEFRGCTRGVAGTSAATHVVGKIITSVSADDLTVLDTHYVPVTRQITTDSPLAGGGTLAADLEISSSGVYDGKIIAAGINHAANAQSVILSILSAEDPTSCVLMVTAISDSTFTATAPANGGTGHITSTVTNTGSDTDGYFMWVLIKADTFSDVE